MLLFSYFGVVQKHLCERASMFWVTLGQSHHLRLCGCKLELAILAMVRVIKLIIG